MKKIRLHLSKTSLKDDDLVCKLQGFLMGRISDDFASFLHQQETNPYSLNLRSTREETVWTVNLLSEEAERQILPQLLSLEIIKLETYPEDILVKNIEIQSLSPQALLELFQGEEASHLVSLNFYTPTTFKSQGQFVLFPDTRLIFQSLMQKYSRLVEGKAEIEEETLQFLAEHSQISSYRLKSHYFPIHGRKYPAFEGRVTIRIQGASTLKAYAQMLLRFGEYSGVGTKCSLGMGGMKIEERKA
ncbi:CRISPR-associated endoribonuclease Cas6 [Streptococcus sp. DD11]|uniref:CRISPR-associated endoribonuclease Cas6 n=1 Tax=Streptococcus sp. DD11 TaxID=1777879 RepID=UPI000A5538B8|nr:CRISPR-associated endoribonuclease Cas6 [Streptococcus sp. DD11]